MNINFGKNGNVDMSSFSSLTYVNSRKQGKDAETVRLNTLSDSIFTTYAGGDRKLDKNELNVMLKELAGDDGQVSKKEAKNFLNNLNLLYASRFNISDIMKVLTSFVGASEKEAQQAKIIQEPEEKYGMPAEQTVEDEPEIETPPDKSLLVNNPLPEEINPPPAGTRYSGNIPLVDEHLPQQTKLEDDVIHQFDCMKDPSKANQKRVEIDGKYYDFDANGNVTKVYDSQDAKDYSTRINYGDDGNIQTYFVPKIYNGYNIEYQYDGNGDIAFVTRKEFDESGNNIRTFYYDKDGYPDGVCLTTYENGKRVASDMFNAGGLFAGHDEYRYDANGNEVLRQLYNAQGQKCDDIDGW